MYLALLRENRCMDDPVVERARRHVRTRKVAVARHAMTRTHRSAAICADELSVCAASVGVALLREGLCLVSAFSLRVVKRRVGSLHRWIAR